MRRSIHRAAFLLAIGCACGAARVGKRSTEAVVFRAMQDELTRNLGRLQLEDLEKPFYISYDVRDFELLSVSAALGAGVRSDLRRFRDHGVRVLVGSYERNDENFLDYGGMFGRAAMRNATLPLEDDYHGIRRALWIAVDAVYKNAAETLVRKQAALAQQAVAKQEAEIADFARAPPHRMRLPPRSFPIDAAAWEETAARLSAVFRVAPEIFSSKVVVTVCRGMVYLANTEGTRVAQPVSYVGVSAQASTQAIDGAPLDDAIAYHGRVPADLPPVATMSADIRALAARLVALRRAPPMDATYTGPVLFEEQAAAELVVQRLFSGSAGLLAYRRPVVSDSRASGLLSRLEKDSLLERIGKRILPRHVTITAQPKRERALGKRLIGAAPVDAEGVVPPDEIMLVKSGVLEAMLSNRTPTRVSATSNGHHRYVVGRTGVAGGALGPSVVQLTSSKRETLADLRKRLIQLAEEEGLEHAFVVRRLASMADGVRNAFTRGGGGAAAISRPTAIFRISVATGEEELVRSAALGGVTASVLRRIGGLASEAQVYNTLTVGHHPTALVVGGGTGRGVAMSLIVPRGILLEELEVAQQRRDYTPTLPVVPSPLASE